MNFIKNLSFILISLPIPGASLLLTGSIALGFSVPLIALAWTLFFSYTRFIVTMDGFSIFLLGMLFIHLGTFIWGVTRQLTPRNQYSQLSARLFLPTTFLVLANVGIVVSSHIYKDRIYGFAFFHIPSASMSPTLLPGDIIMVDTWTHKNKSITIGDILVFRTGEKGLTLVKRVAKIRKKRNNQEMFMRGDNPSHSTDSRTFGWIAEQKVIGTATFVWFSFRYYRFFLEIR